MYDEKIKDIQKRLGEIKKNKTTYRKSKIKLKNGDIRIIQWHNNRIFNEIRKKEEILAVGVDITARKKIERSLKESETRFRALHNASFGGIAIHDKGKILDCNKGLSEMTGYSVDELIGIDGLLLIAEESRDLVMGKILSGCEKPYKAVGIRKNGEEYPLRLEARNIPYKGKKLRAVEFRDITETVKNKKELIVAKVKAEKANQAKSDFLANMSHELRTPLNAILGFSSILKDMEEDEEKKDMAALIEESGDHLLYLINDILNLSKIEAGKIKLNMERFKPEEVLNNLKKSMKGIINRKHENLSFHIIKENKIPKYIKSDKLKIKQILMNLLSNAEKFTEEGKVELKIKYLGDGKIRFQVIDTGMGISKKDQGIIFKEFVQGEHYMTKMHEGTGLGLAITIKLINLLDGHLELESEEKKGSKFTVVIPVEVISSENMQNNVEAENKYAQINGDKKVIVAEDDIINQKLIKTLCNRRGLEIEGANNGKELLEKINKQNYDLILMDIQMPEMDGVTATKKIREKGLEIPIIAITAFAKKEDKEFFLEIGMNDYISKPIDKEKFHEILDEYLI